MRTILICLVALIGISTAAISASNTIEQPYDLLFKTGTLDDIPNDETLIYTRDVTNALEPDAAERDTGRIELGFDSGEPMQASLKFTQGQKHRNLGQFPASVGNPIILYFVETVIRDMAESAGGSPFYIRNRIKESLVAPGLMENGQVQFDGATVATQAITLSPFQGDPNADRMKGFGDLRLEVTMSEDVPGWYHSLRAFVPDPASDTPIYSSTLTFKSAGPVQ